MGLFVMDLEQQAVAYERRDHSNPSVREHQTAGKKLTDLNEPPSFTTKFLNRRVWHKDSLNDDW